jgi:hypothetical protein
MSARTIPLFDRPGGRQLAQLPRGSNIIVMKLDRIFRNTIDGLTCQEHWLKQDVSLHIANQGNLSGSINSAAGWLTMTNFLAIAEYEAKLIAERTAAAMNHLQDSGRSTLHPSKLPYGLMKDPDKPGFVTRCDAECHTNDQIMQYSDRGYDPSDICKLLKQDHPEYKTRSGKPFTLKLIEKIIRQQGDPTHWAHRHSAKEPA